MGYREVSGMQVQEVLRRQAAGESRRAIARATGLSRNTVEKYLRGAAEPAAVEPASGVEVLSGSESRALPRAGRPGPVVGQHTPRLAELEPWRGRIQTWVEQDRLRLTRVQELLSQAGLAVAYTTLRRFVAQAGLGQRATTTVRLVESPPGELAEMDFGRLGILVEPASGKRRVVWALVVVLPYSRHSFVWPLYQQTLEAVVEGLEASWRFFGGVTKRLILDNFPAAVAGPDPLTPRPTRGFLEYSQARGFLIDPARVRHPKDKPHVERQIQYVRERFWKGGSFHDLADARRQAERWSREVAGQRVHGTTRQLPAVVFQDQEHQHLLAAPTEPYDLPRWSSVTVHPDHHIAFLQALYSVPATSCPAGTKLEVRGDRDLVKLYLRGELVKTHPRMPRGSRHTDQADYPQELTGYTTRAPDHLRARASALGEQIGTFATQLLSSDLPWAKLRQGQKLLKLADRYGTDRLEAACRRALAFELLDVRRVERILVQALDREGLPSPPVDERLRPLPGSRFARPGRAFDHQQAAEREGRA